MPFSLWESKSAREFERAQRGEGPEAEVVESGAQREKRLRKLAQRGVVRLFNAIGAAQGAPEKAQREEDKKRKREEEEAEERRNAEGAGPGGKVTRRPNVLGGRGKGEACECPRFVCCGRSGRQEIERQLGAPFLPSLVPVCSGITSEQQLTFTLYLFTQ